MVSAKDVKELREKTGAGMLDCKKALEQTNGDIQKAIDYLREKGLSKAMSKQSRIAADGLADFVIEGNKAVIFEVNSETDFVAKNENFKELVTKIGQVLIQSEVKTVEEALQLKVGSETVEQLLFNLTAKIGEKLTLRRFERFTKEDNQAFAGYKHMGGKIVTLVTTTSKDEQVNKDLAMQVAAAKPQYLSREFVDQKTVEHEKEILTQQALNEGKPAAIVEKMIVGRLNKYFEDICLVDQAFIKDPNIRVSQYLKQHNAQVLSYTRLEVGEGMEKRCDNFAAEVEAQINAGKK